MTALLALLGGAAAKFAEGALIGATVYLVSRESNGRKKAGEGERFPLSV